MGTGGLVPGGPGDKRSEGKEGQEPFGFPLRMLM